MKVRLLKDWSWNKAGDVVDVFDPLADDWIRNGVAELFTESRSVAVERAVEPDDPVERAVITERRRAPKR